MGALSRLRPAVFAVGALVLAALLGAPSGGQAAHDMGWDCYTCHNIQWGQVWPSSYSIWSGKNIGMSPYSRPITCDICHTDYGTKFGAASVSKHPVRIIVAGDNTRADNNAYGSSPASIDCRDCHSGDVTTLSPNLVPDVSPLSYLNIGGNGVSDGYPNHDNTIAGSTIVAAVWGPQNVVTGGTEPHLGSSYDNLARYNKVPSNSPLTDYALCFSCHDGTAGRTNRRVDVKTKYSTGKGHYYKYGTPTGGANGNKMPCSDCHTSHNAQNNSRLYASPKGTVVVYSNAVTPSAADIRTICMDCHDDYGTPTNGIPLVRGVEPPTRKTGVAGHQVSDAQSCAQCHDPHDTPGGGPDCLTCHTAGGGAGAAYEYIDALFKGVGSDNGVARPADAAPLSWSQHGGFNGNQPYFVYQSPYNTKASNDCVKCHGDRHNNTYKLIDADPGDTYVFDNTAVSLRAATQANANAFCLTCHDGNGSDANIRIGGTSAPYPPNVAATWATRGHGLSSGNYTVSGNGAANIKCIDCHEVHGSNHAKLLPADNTATGNFAMPAGKPGMTFRSGAGLLLASALDFRNHSLPSSGDTFGTTGNPGALTSAPQGYTGTATTGLCDACHRYSATPPAGTVSTYNKTHTHEGIAGQGSPAAQMTFTKDCVECHNPHGGANANVYMIHDNITVTQATIPGTFPVTFTDNASFDPSGAGTALCNVCHANSTQDAALNVSHNFRSAASPDHAEGTNCTSCHAHGKTDNTATFGFPQAGCNTCHGPLSDTAGMPSATDGATYDTDANNIIGTRGGTDNTAHYIHVAYLVNKRGIARGNTCAVCHVGGGGAETGGHPANPTNKTYKSLPTPTAVPYLQVALDNTGAVLNVWNGAGTGPTYSGTPGTAASVTSGWKTCSNTNCHYALSPSWSGKRQYPPGTMTVSTPDALPAAGSLNAGSANNVVDKIRLQANASGMVTDNQFKVRLAAGSTAQNGTDIARVTFWEDADNDNTVDAGDVQIGGNAVFSASDNGYTVAPVSYTVLTSTTKSVLVAVDVAPGAVNGRTMTFSTVNGDITASYGSITAWTTFSSSAFTVSAPGTLTVTTPDALPAAGPVMVGSGNNLVDKINLAATGGYATVTGLKVRKLGTAANGTDIANVTFWHDNNANGTLEPATDTLLGGGAAAFNAGDNTYSITGLSLNVPNGTTENILIADNVAAGATLSRTIQTQVVDNTCITLSAGTVAGTFPIAASSIQTISSGGQLTVTTPDALPAAGDIRGASDNNVIDKITLTAASLNVVVSGLWVRELGTSADGSDIASVSFVDNTGGANTVLGTATFNAADNTYRLGGLGLTVAVGTPRTILVMANISNGAAAARTVQTQVNDGYVQVSAGTVNTITSFSSTIQTIRALTAVIVTDTAGSTTPVGTTTLNASGTHQFYATATYSNAALNQNVTTSSDWSVTGTAGGTVGASTGLYTAGAVAGTDTVTAAYRGQSDNTTVNVTTAVAFPATTYIVNISSGIALGWGNTNMTSGTAKTTQNDNTLLVKSGETITSTYYGATVTTERTAYNAIWNTALAAGSNTTITGVTFNIRIRKSNTNDRVRLQLMYFNPTGGAATAIYDTGLVDPGGTVGITGLFTHTSPAISVPVPDGMKLGVRVGFQQGSTTAMRVHVATGTAAQNTQAIISGTNATGVAPAPPRLTGDTTAIACNSCHQFGPDDATAGPSPDGQYYYALPGSHAAHGVMNIAGNDPAADNALNTCTICHLATTNTFGSDHMNGTVDLRSGAIGTRTAGPAYADDGTYDNGSRTCSNTYCHAGRATPRGGVPLRSWGYGSATCGVCHAVTPPYGKHAVHNNGNVSVTPTENSTAGNYDFSCYYCHPSGAAHVNYPVSSVQAAQVVFSGTLGSQTLAGNYTPGGTAAGWDNVTNQGLAWTNGSCATYCHTDGKGGPALVTPTWNHAGFPTAACTGCHDDAGSSTGLSVPHLKHTDNTAGAATYKFTCDECHAVTVADNQRTVLHATTGRPNHVDGILTVQFGSTLRSTAVAIGGSYTQGVDNCANTYCHSDGSSLKNSGTIQANSVTWAAGPQACNSCHGTGGASGAPDYPNVPPLRNSHDAHSAIACAACHSQTTTTGNTITGADNHVNGSYNVSASGNNVFTYTFNTGGSTCAFTSGCHGTATVTWGTPLANGCFSCHAGTEQLYKPQNDYGVANSPNPVDNTQYLTRGHGRPAASGVYPMSNNPAAHMDGVTASPSDCYYCHSQNAAHVPANQTNDPFRLGFNTDNSGQKGSAALQGAYADNVDLLCVKCHGSAADRSGVAEAATVAFNAVTHVNGITGTKYATWPRSPWKCIDCHDPHGDANNHMIRSGINAPNNSTDALAGSDAKGRPQRTGADVHAITFTDNSGYAANSYAIPGAGSWGICEVCHTQTAAYAATGTGTDNAGTHGGQTSGCMTCHTHDTGFKGRGCIECHGVVEGPRRPVVPEFGYTSHHSQNVNASTVTKVTCGQCHMEANADGSLNAAYHNNGASSPYPVDLVVYTTYPTRGTPVSIANVSQADLRPANASCMSCHNATNAASTPFSGQGDTRTPTTYSWDGISVAAKYNNVGSVVGTNVTPFGKYSSTTYNTVPADLVNKAFSPHGNVINNHGGHTASSIAGWTDRGGATSGTAARPAAALNVACLDCHNSHGSNVDNATSYVSPATAYTQATTSPGRGGLLKTTASYAPAATGTPGAAYYASPQANFCFDCHLGDNAAAPKTYTAFGMTQTVDGYYDAGRWRTTDTWTGSFAYKSGAIKGGHLGESATRADGTALFALKSVPTVQIYGLCTRCHDPHGINPANASRDYMTPGLKGTWMTSPYLEDRGGDIVSTGAADTNTNTPQRANYLGPRQTPYRPFNRPAVTGGGYGTTGGSNGYNGFFIDENTFGSTLESNTTVQPWSVGSDNVTYITQTDTQFGGLCLNCHPKTAIGTVNSTNGPYTFSWTARGTTKTEPSTNDTITVHRTVKGWDSVAAAADIFKYYMTLQHVMNINGGQGGRPSAMSSYSYAPAGYRWSVNPGTTMHAVTWAAATDVNFGGGTNNYGGQQNVGYTQATFHQFPCSKCHTAHASRLPRLMKTNCLDVGPSNSGATAVNLHGSTTTAYTGNGFVFGAQEVDIGATTTNARNERPMHCHNQRRTNKTAGGGWNTITGWP